MADADDGHSPSPLLQVDDLVVRFRTRDGPVTVVDGVGFTISSGETLGIVGESGSGKTVTMLSVLGLLPSPPAEVAGGTAVFRGEDLLAATSDRLRALRGQQVAMIFQDPMTSLNPVLQVGEQIREALWVHDRRRSSRGAHLRRVHELLELVGIPDVERRAQQYPHEFSGGMRQRAMIAMAIANKPALLVADEPTTALDVTIQAQVIDVLMAAKSATGAATILITHDLGLVSEISDRVIVMYAGRVVEQNTTAGLFTRPRHPYTIGLLASLPSLDHERPRLYSIPGQPPTAGEVPEGCPFRPRCAVGHDRQRCLDVRPELQSVDDGLAACHFVDEVEQWVHAELVSSPTDGTAPS